MKKIVLLILLIASINGWCQKARKIADSLLPTLTNLKQDAYGVKTYSKLADAYYSLNPDSFFIYSNKGIALSKALHLDSPLIQFQLKESSMLTDTGNYTLALKYAQQSLALALQLHLQDAVANSYVAIGRVYDFQSDFVKSSDYFFKAMSVAKDMHDHAQMALAGTNLSAAFFNEGDYAKCEKYALETLQEATIANIPVHAYKAYYMLGMVKAAVNDTLHAREYYEKAIEICRKNAFTLNEAEVETDLSFMQKDNAKRIELLLHARKIYDTLSPSSFDSRINWEDLGYAYINSYKASPSQKQLLEKAHEYLSRFVAKSRELNDIASIAQGLQKLSEAEALMGNYKLAYDYSNQFHAINDSIFSQDNKNKIAALENRNEVEKKNLEIENQKLQVKKERKNIALLLAGLIIAVLVSFLFYRISSIRKQQNTTLNKLNNDLDEANKVKDRFFGILSHDLRNPVANLINFLNLQKRKPGLLNEQQVAEHENKISRSAQSLLETMESLLLWSKSQMQHFRPEISAVQLATLYNYLQNNFANLEHIKLMFTGNRQLQVNTDENYVKTIMYNLTANAVKALQNNNDGCITWHAWQDGKNIFFSIADNGPGIDRRKLQVLYDDAIISSAREGMGLHIIRDFAKAIGCTVTLNEAALHGTEFILRFGC